MRLVFFQATATLNTCLLSMNIKELAYSQFIDTDLNRYDVFVRCLAIDNYFKRNPYGFDLYNKMQRLRGADVESYDWDGKFKTYLKFYS